MEYTLKEYNLSENSESKAHWEERCIQKVYKLSDRANRNRVRIKWDCLKEDDNDLIVVIRSISLKYPDLSKVDLNNLPNDTHIFVYPRKETDDHIECDRKKGAYSYYVFTGKLEDNNQIVLFNQTNGKNIVTGTTKADTASGYAKPEGKLYYQYFWEGYIAKCVLSIGIGWIIYSFVDYLKIPSLQSYPRVAYVFFAIAIALVYLICYWVLPSGNWSKRACLHIVRKARYTDKEMLQYTVSAYEDEYCIQLKNTSNDVIIPLKSGDRISFNNQDIQLKVMSYLGFLFWKYIKKEKS